MVIATRPR